MGFMIPVGRTFRSDVGRMNHTVRRGQGPDLRSLARGKSGSAGNRGQNPIRQKPPSP